MPRLVRRINRYNLRMNDALHTVGEQDYHANVLRVAKTNLSFPPFVAMVTAVCDTLRRQKPPMPFKDATLLAGRAVRAALLHQTFSGAELGYPDEPTIGAAERLIQLRQAAKWPKAVDQDGPKRPGRASKGDGDR